MPSPLSLVIGVTGHRDLRPQDIARLETTFASALFDISRNYPHASPLLLSALAEGADRLAARVALQMGIRVVVPMPMPQALYECDFETPDSLSDFRALLSRAAGVIHLPLLDGTEPRQIERPGLQRDREYAKAGAYIAAQSQLFFAFWDGVPDEGDKIGGTAQTVGFRLKGAQDPSVRRRSLRMFGADTGPVFHIETPRLSNPASASLSCAIRHIVPETATMESFDKICRRIDLFNNDASRLSQEPAAAEESAAGLLNVPTPSVPSILEQLPAGCRRMLEQYSAADRLALRFRARALSTWVRVFVGVAVSALFFNIHSSFFAVAQTAPSSLTEGLSAMPWFLIASLACSAFTASWLYGRAEKGEYQTKYQDYRALAEALRIQFFWRIAGVTEPVVDRYLRKQHSELEWIRSALRSCDVMAAISGPAPEKLALPRRDRLELVSKWVGNQRRYYSSKASAEKAKLEKETTTVGRLLKFSAGFSIVLALILTIPLMAAAVSATALHRLVPSARQHGAWMVVIPMLAVSGGLLLGYGKQLARAEHVRQFGRMSELFYAAEIELQALVSQDGESAAGLVRELGIEALDENGDWLILHRERPLEVPPG